ncbi:MAG TPA: transglycosylase SLT domain-containing protein [Nitrospiraceae bacterium]|nr:transglycosylase SLT domain-containing protein [Nitrospiraceae bacterium]
MLASVLLVAVALLHGSSIAADPNPVNARSDSACESAEDCFRAALVQKGQPDKAANKEDRLRARVERLRLVMEQHPGSLWAKRAGLVTGVLLTEREPADAVRFLRAAQRDFPFLEDYIRFWLGEALLKMGDALPAAMQLESIPETVPDTLLTNRATLRSGEAWYRAGQCQKAIDPLTRVLSQSSQDPAAPSALLSLADCQIRENRTAEGYATLRQAWIQYPQTPEARVAMARLVASIGSEMWHPTPDDLYSRARTFFTLSLHGEAVDELQKFLSAAPHHPRRNDAKLKLGTSLVRLKRYEQARQVFQDLVAERVSESSEAAVWLARIYLRQGDGEQLLAMPQSFPKLSLSAEQKAAILLFAGIWLEDQGQNDQALTTYRQAAKTAGSSGQKSEALWRTGWIQYRTGYFREAVQSFQQVVNGNDDFQITPQALYWMARALESQKDDRVAEAYSQLCRKYPLSYYGQLAGSCTEASTSTSASGTVSDGASPSSYEGTRTDLGRDLHYRKASELKLLGLDQEAARELSWLTESYARDRRALLELSVLLSEAGAYHHALRVARLHFRDGLERGGEPIPLALWRVAYPTGYLPTIQAYTGNQVDPYLVAAIIREESQYDLRAVSRVGAVGLMQVMPATAQAVARGLGVPDVMREELFNQEINIRLGVGYLAQLLQQFSGNVMYAVAAYNAGPAAVSAWILKHGDTKPDEFVELIPYQETRQYVKRVLRSYREYHRLERGTCAARSLDKVC